MDNSEELKLLIASRHPLIVIETRDELRLMALLRHAAERLSLPVWCWSATRGLARDGADPQYATTNARKALDFVDMADLPGLFVFNDVQASLTDAVVVRRFKEVAQTCSAGQTIVITGASLKLPPELDGVALPWRLKPPAAEELNELVRGTLAQLRQRDVPVLLAEQDVERLAESLRGLSLAEAERLVQRAAVRDGRLDAGDVDYVREAKAEILGDTGILELITGDHGTLADVGGMDGLKAWLEIRRKAFLDPTPGLDSPRGVLLTGVPGCGKSFLAKSLARTWGLPLVLLDPARIYASYVGESEQRLASALETIESLSPAVLWIDEIEKGFASGGTGDGGVSRRLLGTFLRWMQDRPPGVFVVATCNEVTSLPPEFLRKGRFDELFFVDLPTDDERRQILVSQLRRRSCDPAAFDLEKLAALCEGFSGAEIEAAVVAAMYRAHADGSTLATQSLAFEIEATVPLSRSRPEDVDALRAWASARTVPASRPAADR